MHTHTTPSIAVAQNYDQSERLIAAQARLYSDVKRNSALRFAAIALTAVVLAGVSIAQLSNVAVGTIGGLLVLLLQILFTWQERQKILLASSIQEQFDTSVYQLPWNEVLVRRRPNGQEVVRAAARYTGGRSKNWYPLTGPIIRPLDILICQQSNVGWGIPIHRIWGWILSGCVVIGFVILGLIWHAASLSFMRGLDAMVVPFVPVLWEVLEHIRTNFASAKDKDELQQLLLTDWNGALNGSALPTIDRCRLFQDQIVIIRRTNAHVPDWLDRSLRKKSERAMRTTSHDMVEDSKRAGLT